MSFLLFLIICCLLFSGNSDDRRLDNDIPMYFLLGFLLGDWFDD